MSRLLRLLTAPLLIVTLVLTGAPARADSDPLLATQWQLAWDTYRFYEHLTGPLPLDGRTAVTRDLPIDIDAPLDHVFAAYSDINHHIGLHPFLKRVATHADYVQDGLRYVNFTAVEDVPVTDGVPVTVNTHAQQRVHAAEYFYETDTWTMPNVVTHQRIDFTDLGGGRTRVTEHLTFEANVLLIDFTVTNGVSSHQQTQVALKEAIESGRL
ncbi:SRPBCC family protein [Nonomuraea sp. NPDC050022]|uniref:SRPBCC family protein n=1 Tax=unclassified Nonomuraea TaxID=2593643 RepID=UPI0033F3C378